MQSLAQQPFAASAAAVAAPCALARYRGTGFSSDRYAGLAWPGNAQHRRRTAREFSAPTAIEGPVGTAEGAALAAAVAVLSLTSAAPSGSAGSRLFRRYRPRDPAAGLLRPWRRHEGSDLTAAALPNDDTVDISAKTRRRHHSLLLISVYIICDISVYIVGDFATQGYTKQTVLFTSALTSVMVGSIISFVRFGWKGLSDCFDARNVVRLLPVSAAFSASLLSLLLAFPHFDGAFIKLLGQMKLPLTALLSFAVLGRRYNLVQWQIILLICVSCVGFTAQRLGGVTFSSMPVVGLLYVFSWIVFNVLATLLAERILKGGRGAGRFVILMTHLRIGEVLTNLMMMCFLMPNFHTVDFFKGWDRTTVFVLMTLLGDAWLSGLMVKRLSSVTKNVSKCCSLAVLYGYSIFSGRIPLVLAQALGAVLIMQSTALFAIYSAQKQRKEEAAKTSA